MTSPTTDTVAVSSDGAIAEPLMTYVVEEQVDERCWEVSAVRLSLDAAFALGERIVGDVPAIEWREGTTSTHLGVTDLRDWSAHRPRRPAPTVKFIGHDYRPQTWSETYLGVTITEHPVPAEEHA